MIDDSVGSAPGTRGAEDHQAGSGVPELDERPNARADSPGAAEASPDLPRDIAKDLPRDIAKEGPRAPIRDIARDPGLGGTGVRERVRDPALRDKSRDTGFEGERDPLREFLRDVAASREPPRQAPPLPPSPAPVGQTVEPPRNVTVRSPGLSLLAVILLIVGIVGGGLLGWQLMLLQGQMNDLRTAITQNGKIADAVGRLSDAATQANEIAGQSLTAATRPWVGIDAVQAGGIEAGQSLNIEVRVRNSGRTPSTDVQGLFLVYISPLDNPPALLVDPCASCVRSVVLPNGIVSYKLSVRDSVMTADEVQRIKDGKDTMWIVGRLDYHDGEGDAHVTRSCLYYRGGGVSSFTACGDGNSAN